MSAFVDGELGDQRHSRMERHLSECHECRRLLGGLRRVIGYLHRLPRPESEDAGAQIAASVRVRLRTAGLLT